ncbi:hypothetical protein Tco_1475776 [Tanacetum coccineum]
MPTIRTAESISNHETTERRIDLDILEERRKQAAIREEKAKLQMKGYYDAKVRGVSFRPGDFVYHANDASHAEDTGKLGPKWEGPYDGYGSNWKRSKQAAWTMDGVSCPARGIFAILMKCYLIGCAHCISCLLKLPYEFTILRFLQRNLPLKCKRIKDVTRTGKDRNLQLRHIRLEKVIRLALSALEGMPGQATSSSYALSLYPGTLRSARQRNLFSLSSTTASAYHVLSAPLHNTSKDLLDLLRSKGTLAARRSPWLMSHLRSAMADNM